MNRKNKNFNNNKLKNEISCLLSNIKFKSLNLTLSKKIIIISIFIWFISLFLPWINDLEKGISWNSFYSLTWNIWFLLIFILLLPIFIIFSTNYKEKIKLYSDLSVKNHFLIITSWFIIISFSIISLSFINWLHTFFENIFYWKWVILCMTAWFIMLFWWILLRKEYYQDSSEIILNKLNQNREKLKEDDNMKLPF
jgi:hypothetical protein